MQLDIISPDHNIYSGEVSYIQLPGIDGSFGILNDHAPLVSALSKGVIKVTDSKDKEITFDISGGVIEVLKNKVIILAD